MKLINAWKDMDYYTNNMFHALGMHIDERKEKELIASMQVGHQNCQILGYLSGGASIAMAEIVAGIGSLDLLDDMHVPLGISVTANHVKAAPFNSKVYAHASIISISRSLHLWNIDIVDEEHNLISTVRVTNKIVKKPKDHAD